MILKRIILTGFKSFPDRTEFAFDEGVTCIVGPNGCGKSNVVDAVKWVLGEQSAKSLRGSQMSDMIFNGSSSRRSCAFAQVDLTFDNQDGTLDMDQSEITVSRRLYRSGESEYLLNLEPQRLKDIRELFLDTGVGVDAYSIIEQGKVDVLLQSNARERRIIFEEAAGISKYKVRRREAERKLERTQQNLTRAQDIIEELERRLRSVKLQAGKARNFQEYDRRLRELRASYALSEYHRRMAEHQQIEQHIASYTDESVQRQSELARHEAEMSALAAQVLELDQQIDQATQQSSALKSQLTAVEERSRSAAQRREEQQEMIAEHRAHAAQHQERIESLTHNLHVEQQKLPALASQSDQHAARVAELTARDQQLAAQIAELQATAEDEKSGVIELLRQGAELRNQITELSAHRQSLSGQKHRLETRDGEIRTQLQAALQRKADIQARMLEIEDLMRREQDKLAEQQQAAAAVRSAQEAAAHAMHELKEKRSALRSQRDLLQELESKMEGVDRAVRELLRRKAADPDNPHFAAIQGMVADVITTESRHAPVIEAALERWAQHLVIQDSSAFLSLNGELDLKGRLHVLCADRLNPVMDNNRFVGKEGYLGRAIDLVAFPEQLEYLTRHILGRTVVVESFEHALAMAEQDVHGYEFVTLRGEVVDGNGRMALGAKAEKTGLIARKSRLREVTAELQDLEQEIQAASETLDRYHTEHAHLENLLHELRAAITENHATRAETEAAVQHALAEVNRLTGEQPLIAGEVALIEKELQSAADKASLNSESLARIEAQNNHREAQIESCQQRIEELAGERAGLQEALTEARIAAGQLAEKRAAVQDAIHSQEAALESARQTLRDHLEHIARCEQRGLDASTTMEACRAQSEELARTLQAHEQQALQLRHQREAVRLASEQSAEIAKRLRAELSDTEERLHAEQMKLQELAVRQEELCARIRDELSIDLAEAYAGYEHQQQDWEAVEAEIQELRAKITRLGNINLDAIKEQEELEERLQFLTGQRQDLEESRQQLETLIARLNAESRERFMTTFTGIRTHFQNMFRKLFGGGKADLVLDPTCDDVLEAGIDILARPPGKELQSISLLSGGEKTLTAIALLMSILKTKPSPFVLLDEVDAALDEANNERFNRLVQEFLDQSQFIIITHSKPTMHIADTLYGVTMQEAGVSRRVTVRFEEQQTRTPAVA